MEFLVIKLTDLLVSGYQTGGSTDKNLLPIDQFSLNYGTIQVEYVEQKADGTLSPPITVGWDVKSGRQL